MPACSRPELDRPGGRWKQGALGRCCGRAARGGGPGPGGVTRLAQQVAAQQREEWADGVVFVELATLGEAALVPGAIAQALGVQETAGQPLRETLHEALRAKQLLLVLDNFEHVLAAAPLVGELLATCPGLRMLAPSRAALP